MMRAADHDSSAQIEALRTERAQLKGVIDVLDGALHEHLEFCNERVGEAMMQRERETQRMHEQRRRYEAEQNELASEKAALKLMAQDAHSGTVMTLVEHNLFVVATLHSQGGDSPHLIALSQKVKAIQNRNRRQNDTHSNSNSNS